MRANYLFTSESVAEGHPDKVCDRISDEIVDLVYREAAKTGVNPWGVRIACETLATTNRVVIAGEVRVPPSLMKKDKDGKRRRAPIVNPSKFKATARRPSRTSATSRTVFTGRRPRSTCCCTASRPTSPRASIGPPISRVTKAPATRASCSATPAAKRRTCMPAPIYYSHKILEAAARARKKGDGDVAKLGPDAKSQVTVRYEDGKPVEASPDRRLHPAPR